MNKIKFSSRISKRDLRRIYEDDAKGLHDEKLIDEVGIALYLRCCDILAVKRAKEGSVRCPNCWDNGEEVYIERPKIRSKDTAGQPLICHKCGFSFLWGDYTKAFKRNQLNSGGAMPAFEYYTKMYPRSADAQTKMLLIDRLIHEFHYSNKKVPGQPTRSVGPNLISGKLTDILRFLDELSNNLNTGILRETDEDWKDKMEKYYSVYEYMRPENEDNN
jgi:predicted RNA-binding Zn-ribbon protein involved in translation (DUF1610 family)